MQKLIFSTAILQVLILSTLSNIAFAQKKISNKDAKSFEKWSKAIINLEVRPTEWSIDSTFNFKYSAQHADSTTKIAIEKREKLFYEKLKPSVSGTAIYLKYNNNYYLITARHVVEDLEQSATIHKNEIRRNFVIIENYSPGKKYSYDTHFEIYTTFEKTLKDDLKPFEFAPNDLDLAVIDLGHNFMKTRILYLLEQLNYKPIEYTDINIKSKLQNTKNVYVFGYPGFNSVVRDKLIPFFVNYSSASYSLPTISRGRITPKLEITDTLHYEAMIYPGMSGGAIVQNNKLIGVNTRIVSEINPKYGGKLPQYSRGYAEGSKIYMVFSMIKTLEKRFAEKNK